MANFSFGYELFSRNRALSKGYSIFISVFLIVFGAIWIFLTNMALRSINKDLETLKRCTSSATATVYDVETTKEWVSDDDGGGHYETKYINYYSFETNGGKIMGSYKSSNKLNYGDTFEVVYNSDLPKEHFSVMKKNSLPGSKKFIIFFVAIGVAIIIAGVVKFIKTIIKR